MSAQPKITPTKARPMSRPPNYDHQIADFRKNARERVRVSLHEFNGMDCTSLRVFFYPDAHSIADMRPSAKGLTIATNLLPQLLDAVTAAKDKAIDLGLLPKEGPQ